MSASWDCVVRHRKDLHLDGKYNGGSALLDTSATTHYSLPWAGMAQKYGSGIVAERTGIGQCRTLTLTASGDFGVEFSYCPELQTLLRDRQTAGRNRKTFTDLGCLQVSTILRHCGTFVCASNRGQR